MTKVRGIPPKPDKASVIEVGDIVILANGARYIIEDADYTPEYGTRCFACTYTKNLPHFKDNMKERLFKYSDYTHYYRELPPVVRIEKK